MNYLAAMLILFSNALTLEIMTFINNSDAFLSVFSFNKTSANFTFSQKKCCQPNTLYQEIYAPSVASNFTLVKEDNDILPLEDITVLLNNKHNITEKKETYSIASYPNIIELQIMDLCAANQQSSSSVLGKGGLVSVSFKLNHTLYHFDYYRRCKDNPSSGGMSMIISTLFILLLMTIIIFISTHFTLDTDLVTEFKEKMNFDWRYGLVLLFFSLLSVFFLSSLLLVIQYVLSLGMLCILIGTVYLTSASLAKSLLHLQSFPMKLKDLAKRETFSIKQYKIISILVCILLVSYWLFNPNWVLSNVLFFTCVFSSVSLLSIQNYRSLALICIFFTVYDLFLILYSISYTNVLEELDQPIKFLLPKFNDYDVFHPCHYISLIDIVIVCFFIKYSKCFDVVKGNISFAYYQTSVYAYFIGIVVTVAVQLSLKTSQVFLFPLELLLLVGLIVKATATKELKDFWNGENAEGMHKAVSDIISTKVKAEEKIDSRYVRRHNDETPTY